MFEMMRLSMNLMTKSLIIAVTFFCFLARAEVTSFEVKTADDYKISGTFYVTSKEAPLVVLIHMLSRSEADWSYLAPHLLESGFNVVSFDMRGHGKSIKENKTWKDFSDSDFLKVVDDIAAIKIFLKNQNRISVDKIYIVGASMGANLAVKYAHKDPSISGLILLSPGVSYHSVDIQGDVVFPRKIPLLFLTSLGDTYSRQSTQKLVEKYKASKNASVCELKVFSSGEHGTTLFQRYPELKNTMSDWLKKIAAKESK